MSDEGVVPGWGASARLLPDSRLSRLAARGDARAFEAIFKRHHQELYRYCRALLSCPEDAQDALQATMIAALRALPGERREVALRPWLYRVAHNEAISIARRPRETPRAEEPATSEPGADLAAEDRERLRALVADLGSLPERQRGALVMRELSGLPYSDIGGALATSASAARQLVYEAREAMRESRVARETDCAEIRGLISAHDGRVLRGRGVRAHLRGCEGCSDYLAGISSRRADLRLLAPPLPAAAATGILAGIAGEAGTAGLAGGVGSGATVGGGMLGGAGATAGASAVAKGGALLAAAVVGLGAAGVTGALDVPGIGPASSGVESPPAVEPVERAGARATGSHAEAAGRERGLPADTGGSGRSDPRGNANGRGKPDRTPTGDGTGRGVPAGGSDGVTGPPPQANGVGPPPTAGTGTGNAGGNSAAAGGVAAAPPRSATGTEHANAGAGGPPAQANGQGNPHG
jgi:RNA polymerase sigma factor (sigma-70 family)